MVDIYGQIRFSFVPSDSNHFKTSRGYEGQKVADIILSEDRLAARFRLFETYTLPSIKAQLDKDFTIFVAISTLMPEHWRIKMETLVAPVSQIRLCYGEPQDPIRFLKSVLPIPAPEDWRVTFRLDDDDGLANNYISKIRAIARPEYQGMCVSFPKVIHVEDNGISPPVCYPTWSAKHSAGLAYISSPGEKRSIYNIGGHSRVDERCLTIIDSSEFSCVRLFHTFNDHPYPEVNRKKKSLDRARLQRWANGNFDYLFEPFSL